MVEYAGGIENKDVLHTGTRTVIVISAYGQLACDSPVFDETYVRVLAQSHKRAAMPPAAAVS